MTGRIAIFGYGPVGRATAGRLLAEGREVIVAQRRAPPDLPKGAAFAPCDALDGEAVVEDVARKRAVRGRDRLSLCRRRLARRMAARDRQLRRRLQGDRRAHGVHRQSLHVRSASRAARRDHAACRLWLEARRALGRDAHLDGRRGRGRGARRRPARARLLWAGRRPVLSRRHLDRQAREGQARGVRRFAGRPARLRLCAGHRARRDDAARGARLGLRPSLARSVCANAHDPRHSQDRRRGARREASHQRDAGLDAGRRARCSRRSCGN